MKINIPLFKKRIKDMGYTHQLFADACGISRAMITYYCMEKKFPTLETLEIMEKKLKLFPGELRIGDYAVEEKIKCPILKKENIKKWIKEGEYDFMQEIPIVLIGKHTKKTFLIEINDIDSVEKNIIDNNKINNYQYFCVSPIKKYCQSDIVLHYSASDEAELEIVVNKIEYMNNYLNYAKKNMIIGKITQLIRLFPPL